MKVLFVGNHGGAQPLRFYLGMARPIRQAGSDVAFVVWTNSERDLLLQNGVPTAAITTFEDWVASSGDWRDRLEHLTHDYPRTNWSAAIAAERSFTDYCLLVNSTGARLETYEYVQRLLVNIVTMLESLLADCSAVVCQTADTLFSYCVFEVARAKHVEVFAITPAAILESGREGGYFTDDVFKRCPLMEWRYAQLAGHVLTDAENRRVDGFIDSIIAFRGETAFLIRNKGPRFKRTIVTPQLRSIFSYLYQNHLRSRDVEYTKIDARRKAKANLIRLWRRWQTRSLMQTVALADVPEKSVLYCMHFQPEQTTLAQGIYYANQISLIEDLSKSLPIGFTLIVKEHPIGRGTRPAWQYRYLAGLPNVEFCDAPVKDIVRAVKGVITITGSVAVEAMVVDKPAIVLGRTFFSYCELFYRPTCVQELPDVLRRILIDGEYERIANREHLKRRYLLSYLEGLIPYFPFPEHAAVYGERLIAELADRSNWQQAGCAAVHV